MRRAKRPPRDRRQLCSNDAVDRSAHAAFTISTPIYLNSTAHRRTVPHAGSAASNIEHRVFQHKTHAFEGFTSKYNVTNLVYFERHGDVMTAIRREKEMKAWRREEKIQLIKSTNPKWRDLSYGWYQRHQYQPECRVS